MTMYIIYCSDIDHESMTLIVPIMILQAKATDRREQAEVVTEEERHSKGMLYRNTQYV